MVPSCFCSGTCPKTGSMMKDRSRWLTRLPAPARGCSSRPSGVPEKFRSHTSPSASTCSTSAMSPTCRCSCSSSVSAIPPASAGASSSVSSTWPRVLNQHKKAEDARHDKGQRTPDSGDIGRSISSLCTIRWVSGQQALLAPEKNESYLYAQDLSRSQVR
eukprot:scaffold645_cov247-Pinguiococcus_pyrenoidosus.AAC.36